MRFPRDKGFDDEYTKRRKVDQDAMWAGNDAFRGEGDQEREWIMLAIYYQQAWQFAQDHRSIGDRLRWAARAEALADAIRHHMLCENNPKAFDHWHARQSEASYLIQALLVSWRSEID
ncbi:MAG: hypothetical protein R3B95_19530 [Nitrospirales bacterium]|nr:hypothetical protein [Nitrospirales bacterium]